MLILRVQELAVRELTVHEMMVNEVYSGVDLPYFRATYYMRFRYRYVNCI